MNTNAFLYLLLRRYAQHCNALGLPSNLRRPCMHDVTEQFTLNWALILLQHIDPISLNWALILLQYIDPMMIENEATLIAACGLVIMFPIHLNSADAIVDIHARFNQVKMTCRAEKYHFGGTC